MTLNYNLSNSTEYQDFKSELDSTETYEGLVSILTRLAEDKMMLENKVSFILERDKEKYTEDEAIYFKEKLCRFNRIIRLKTKQMTLVNFKLGVVKQKIKQENIKGDTKRHQDFYYQFFKVCRGRLDENTIRLLIKEADDIVSNQE